MPLFNEDGYLIVSETMSCEHFEPVPGRLFCMKECWYCKWSEFDDDKEKSICRYLGNSENAPGRKSDGEDGKLCFAF